MAEDAVGNEPPGLRERKKALMRQYISDVATSMFIDKGFDAVKVSDVAAACDVSEKTVYNYFPTKESLILDREEHLASQFSAMLGPDTPIPSPIDATLHVLHLQLAEIIDYWRDGDPEVAMDMFRRFSNLFDQTPALRAAQAEMFQRIGQVAARAMADRAGMSPDEPEPMIAAHAVTGLLRIQYSAMRKAADAKRAPDDAERAIKEEVNRAARLLQTGLWSFASTVQGDSRQQFQAAARASEDARKQVLNAMKQARAAWVGIRAEAAQPEQRREFEAARRAFQSDMAQAKRSFKQEVERARRNSQAGRAAFHQGRRTRGGPT